MYYCLKPAPGVDYQSRQEVLEALNKGDGFHCEPYVNLVTVSRIKQAKGVWVKYRNNTRNILVNIIDGKATEVHPYK